MQTRMTEITIALAVIVVWLITLSFLLLKLRKHYYSLTTKTRSKNIDDILDSLLSDASKNSKDIKNIHASLKKCEEDGKLHFQKIGFVRFDPFDRAGEQSFVISLLNDNNSGIVLNFMYTREGVRVYAKKVIEGKPEKFELSTEEKEAIRKAK